MVVLVVNYCGGQIAVPERIRTSSKSFQDSVDFEVRELSLIYKGGHFSKLSIKIIRVFKILWITTLHTCYTLLDEV